MIRYFYGEDTYAAREAVAELAKKENARIIFWEAEDLQEESLAEKLERGGGLFEKEIGVVREPSSLRKGVQEQLVAAAQAKRSAEIILWDSEPQERSVVFQYFRKQAQRFPALRSDQLVVWLTREAKQRGVALEARAAALLVARLGGERWRLLSELEKLSIRGQTVGLEEVKKEVRDVANEGEIFEMLRLITEKKKSAAMRQLVGLLAAGNSEFYILSMLAYQLRKLYLAERIGTHVNDLARVVATDFAIKQGKVDARTGITMLVLSLLGPN